MDRETVFTKTAKGITQVNQRTQSLSKDLMKVLKLIDGKSNFGVLLEKSEMDKMVLEKALNTLIKDGFSRIFETKKKEEALDPLADDESGGGDDFDFTAPGKMPTATQRVVPGAANDVSALAREHEKREADKKAAEAAHAAAREKARQQAEARAKAEAEARAKAEAEALALEQARRAKEAAERAKAEMEAKMREEAARKAAAVAAAAKAAAEQKAREEAEAKRMAELRAKAEAEARALAEARIKAEAEAKALAEARAKAEAEARRQIQEAADAAARARAEAEAQAAARARAEAEAKAAAEARAAAEAAEKARAELEARMREEERLRKEAEERAARAAAEAKAREAEEAKRAAEMRAKAEAEAKLLAEARAKAEAEAAALAKARAEAEEAARKAAEDAKNTEKEMKARLKEEIEQRIRAEMEQLLRQETDQKPDDAQTRAQILEEAKLAARAELEERLKEEREELKKAETEARSAAEQAARERADMEAKLRAEAEERARIEAEARVRAELETKRLREAEAKARIEAEISAREREEAAKRLAAERQSMIEKEARAKVEAEERARREKEQAAKAEAERREMTARIEAEKKAREQAELRAKAEAKRAQEAAQDERAKLEEQMVSDMSKKSELEAKAQAKALMEAKLKAEEEEEERMRAEQAQRAREMADILRTKVTPDAEAPDEGGVPAAAKRKARRKRGNLLKSLVAVVVIGFAIAILAIHVIPLNAVRVKAEKGLSAWLHDDVSIQSAKYWLFPTPHLKVEGVSVGKAFDAKAAGGNIYVDYSALWGDRASISSVELAGITISNEALKRVFTWGNPEGKREAAEIRSIRLTGVKLDVKPEVDSFNANLQFDRDGKLTMVLLQGGGKWSASFKPIEGGMDIDFNARYWNLPIGAPIPISDIRLKGTLKGTEIVVPEFEASAMEGTVNGTLRVSWAQGVKMESDLSVQKVKVGELIGALTRDISVTGRMDGNFTVAAEAPNLESLLHAPRSSGKFRVVEGSFSNADLVAVMQSDAAGQRAGVTKFGELAGEYMAGENRAAFRNLQLQGGVLRGAGSLDIGANSALAGRLSLEIRSQVAQDRGTFTVSGTVAKPSIRRGG